MNIVLFIILALMGIIFFMLFTLSISYIHMFDCNRKKFSFYGTVSTVIYLAIFLFIVWEVHRYS